MNLKVTVIMPVYNGERYLEKAIDSILNQTFKDVEFIIVNDGSTDSSRGIILSYDDHRVRLINNEKNIGLTQSLNKGLEAARGQYIARQDADDISFPQRLEKQVEFLETHADCGLVGSFYSIIDGDGNTLKVQRLVSSNEKIQKELPKGNPFCHGACMFRKVCLGRVGLYRQEFESAQDYDLWLRISELWKVQNLKQPLYALRINFQSITAVGRAEQYRYAEFARELARQRQRYGKDRLQTSSKEEIDRILSDMLSKNKYSDKKVLAKGYFHWADLFYVAGDYLEAKKWLLKSFSASLFYGKSWVLLPKLIISWKLSPRIIKGLKVIRDRFVKRLKE